MAIVVLFVLPAAAMAAPTLSPGQSTDVADLVLAPGEVVVYTNNLLNVSGSVMLGTGSSLTLVGSTIRMLTDGAVVSVGPGASLVMAAGSSLKDSLADVDDGSGLDFAYTIDLQAGSQLRVTDSFIEGSYGIDAAGASIAFATSIYRSNRGGVVLSGASMFSAINASFANNPNPSIQAMGTSSADVRGVAMPTYTVAAGAMFSFSVFAAVEVRDTDGKPLGGADWSFETTAGVLAGTARLGGASPLTMLDREGHAMAQWVAVPFETNAGGTKTLPSTVARVKYAEWTDARLVATAGSQLLLFSAMNRGVALEDISEHAMLDNMGMHDMPMDMPMDHGSMPMMDMVGPMMTQGPGAAFGDFNGDGKVDAVVTAAPETDEMYLMEMNMTPEDYPAPELFLGDGMGMFMPEMMSGLEGATGATGASAGDFDGDGDLDLFVSRYGNVGMAMENHLTMEWDVMAGTGLKSMLFRNDGHGMFTEVTASSGIDMPVRHTVGAVWGDYNRDGCLDLYVVNMGELVIPMPMDDMGGMGGMMPMDDMMHMDMGMSYIKNESNYLYKNDCDGTFTDVTAAAGTVTGGGVAGGVGVFQSLVEDMAAMYWMGNMSLMSPSGSGISYTAAWIDFNEDGWPDLLVANDFGVSPLYKNNGDGTFTLWTEEAGLSRLGSAMGFAVADFNRDSHLDVFQSNFNEDFLWMSNGDGTFTDRAAEWGVADMAVGWGVAAPDIDNDGYADLAISAGYMSMMMKASERSVLYLNDGGTRFWDVSAPSGFSTAALGISLALADINADGRLDMFRGNVNTSNQVYLNHEAGGGFVHLDLHGLVSNAYGVGAEVTALIGGKPFKAVVQPGGEYASSNEPGLWVGLGSAKFAQRVMVYWPSGIVQSLGDVAAGTSMVVREQAGGAVDAGPDGTATTSSEVMLHGKVMGATLTAAEFAWNFHGPASEENATGPDVMFHPPAPGVYAVELVVYDRFGDVYGTDVCIMRVTDTSEPVVSVTAPAKITTAAKAVFDAANTTDNDPAFASGAKFEWSFKNGATEVTATGPKPSVQLTKPGTWNVTLKVTDPSGNTVLRTFDAKVTGTAPPPLTQDIVLTAIVAVAAMILGVAVVSRRIWKPEEHATLDDIAALEPEDIVGIAPAGDEPIYANRSDETEEE